MVSTVLALCSESGTYFRISFSSFSCCSSLVVIRMCLYSFESVLESLVATRSATFSAEHTSGS